MDTPEMKNIITIIIFVFSYMGYHILIETILHSYLIQLLNWKIEYVNILYAMPLLMKYWKSFLIVLVKRVLNVANNHVLIGPSTDECSFVK